MYLIVNNLSFIGILADSLKDVDSSLTSNENPSVSSEKIADLSSLFPKKMKKGAISNPSIEHENTVKSLDAIFESHHPKNGLKRGCGVRKILKKKISDLHPNLNYKLVSEFVEIRTQLRIKSINIAIKRKKKGTKRNARKKSEYVCS